MINIYKVLVGIPDKKEPFGRPRHRWDGNIKMDLKNRAWDCGLDSFDSG
jgi:hypothetical protein